MTPTPISNTYQYVGIDVKTKSKYRNLIDPINMTLYNLSKTICVGCIHIDEATDLCSIFSFTYRNQVSSVHKDKMQLSNCPCSVCLVKMKCDQICNEFTEFYIDHRFKLTYKRYDTPSVKQALNIIISVNKLNKDNDKNTCTYEITGLHLDRLDKDHNESIIQTHTIKELISRNTRYGI